MADTDLAELRKQCITSLYLCTDNVSKYLDLEKEEEFEKLKTNVEGYCLLEAQQDVATQALEKAKNETNFQNIDSIDKRFESYLSNLASKRLNVKNHPYMLELNKRYQKELDQTRDLDDSLAITESQFNYIDPITKKNIVNPVKNTTCGHIYEKDAINSVLDKKGKIRCPVVGCVNNSVQKQNLVEDEELKFRMTITQHSTMIQDRSVTNLDATL